MPSLLVVVSDTFHYDIHVNTTPPNLSTSLVKLEQKNANINQTSSVTIHQRQDPYTHTFYYLCTNLMQPLIHHERCLKMQLKQSRRHAAVLLIRIRRAG